MVGYCCDEFVELVEVEEDGEKILCCPFCDSEVCPYEMMGDE